MNVNYFCQNELQVIITIYLTIKEVVNCFSNYFHSVLFVNTKWTQYPVKKKVSTIICIKSSSTFSLCISSKRMNENASYQTEHMF